MLVEFDRIREFESADQKVQTLKDIKNDLIGSSDVKQAYFDQALIETIMPLLDQEKNQPMRVLNETLSVLNCFFFDFPKAAACFTIFKDSIVDTFKWLVTNWSQQVTIAEHVSDIEECAKLKVTSFRVLRNLLGAGVLEADDLMDFGENLVDQISQSAHASETEASLAAQLTSQLCADSDKFRTLVLEKNLVDIYLRVIDEISQKVSEQCLLNCLQAVAAATKQSKAGVDKILNSYPAAFAKIVEVYMRYPDNLFKRASCRIITNCAKERPYVFQ